MRKIELETNEKTICIREQCDNLSQCVERLTNIIERQPGRKDLYLLRNLMENALTNLQDNYMGKV
ncbi:MAG: hypothetical protein KKH41_07595 [Candidatus Thermoplasmatota archaeon]|nr:hypothetical protein [Euryarchaeota archaeon]MBU4031224.1 hypothetical protein [Candidatus Thermoplasmatota archaeon]MBU4143749.1 hypothetical protein [Candidatus Thermoplasmatota archaeon]MBU4592432.1 hypothetical protein [Candidatus Thermoplasmatota archaeon]